MANLQQALIDPQSGAVYMDDGVGFGGAAERRLARLDNRMDRLAARRDNLQQQLAAAPVGPGPSQQVWGEYPADLRQAAAQRGMVLEGQFDGLGSVAIAAGGTGFLQDTLNRAFWAKSLVLDASSPSSILVDSVTIAGLPKNIGSAGAPLVMFAHDATRFGISFGRSLIQVGQTFRVDFTNIDTGSAHTVLGGMIGDEVNPYAAQSFYEHFLLGAVLTAPHAYAGY